MQFQRLKEKKLDVVIGSPFFERFKRTGLSKERSMGSTVLQIKLCRLTLPKKYKHITDYQSICMGIKLSSCLPIIYKVDVNGFKFFYEMLAISSGKLNIDDVALDFKPGNMEIQNLI